MLSRISRLFERRGKERPARPLGRLLRFPDFPSEHLEVDRDITIYLPPGYGDDAKRRFPVFYIQDGQNLFDPETAFIRGKHWRLGETAGRLILAGRVAPVVIVGVGNGGESRIDEYTPWPDERRGEGGRADLYGRFLVEELMPFVDGRVRTETGPRSTGLGGASLGGLVSLYLALARPDVFGSVAALSPSVWWHRSSILRTVRSLRDRPDVRIWLDIGSEEGRSHVKRVRLLRDALRAKGWNRGSRMAYLEAEGAVHDEFAWGERAGAILEYLFPPRRTLRRFLVPRKGGLSR